MSWTFIICILIAFIWMGMFYLWGRSFLTFIHAERNIVSSITFGYLVLQIIYQIVYIPFLLTRGSYRATAYIWMSVVGIASLLLVVYLRKHLREKRSKPIRIEKVGICGAIVFVFGLSFYISLHVPFYGADTVTYITTMNNAYYLDTIWITDGDLSIHHGLCSVFHFFTMSSLVTGVKPYYTSLFTMRIIGVCLFAMIMYRIGAILFQKPDQRFCWSALLLAVLTPTILLFWGSNYTAEFFYWRINEGKGYCQFVLMPLGFSIFLEMFRETTNRRVLWKEQLVVGLAAMAVSSSSMTPYIFLVLMGACAVLAFDKLKSGWRTIGNAIICSIPNLIFLALYILVRNKTLTF